MVKAAEKIIPVFVDCDWGKKNQDLSGKYGVRGYPTVIFTDPKGEEIDKLGGRDAKSVLDKINAVAEKFGGIAALDSWDKGAEAAKDSGKPVLYFFATQKADSVALEQALMDESLKELLEKFVLVKSEIKRDSEDAKKFKVTSSTSPVLLILTPAEGDGDPKVVKKLTGKKSAKDLKKEFEKALKDLEKKEGEEKEEGGGR